MIRLLAPLSLMLVACTPPGADGAGEPMAEPVAQPAADRILGDYVVTFVDGKPPVIGIAGEEPRITIGPDRIHFQSQCIYADWTYTRDGEAVATKEYYEPGSTMCARALAPGETAIIDAITQATILRLVPRGLWLSDDGERSVQLQHVPSAAELATRNVDLGGEWRVAGIDGQEIAGDYAIALSADFHTIWWEPGCAGQGRAYTISGNRFATIPPEPGPHAVCAIGYPDEVPQIWAALDASDTIERTAENGVRISGKGRSVLLFAQ